MLSLLLTIYKIIKIVFFKLPAIWMVAKLVWKYLYKAILALWLIILVILKKRK